MKPSNSTTFTREAMYGIVKTGSVFGEIDSDHKEQTA